MSATRWLPQLRTMLRRRPLRPISRIARSTRGPSRRVSTRAPWARISPAPFSVRRVFARLPARSVHTSRFARFCDAAPAEATAEGADDMVVAPEDPKDYSPKVLDLVEQVMQLNMYESIQFVDLLQDKFGITDTAMLAGVGGAPAAAPAAAAEEAPAVEEKPAEKTEFTVMLKGFDAKSKIKVIKEVRAITGLGLKEAKETVEKAPVALKEHLTKDEAEELQEKLKAAGAEIALE